MQLRVKICGVTTREDALCCVDAGADAIGFIFATQSPRQISPEKAAAIIAELPRYVAPVGVFVNETRSEIERIIALTGIRILQLSGDEEPADCEGYAIKVWKAFRLASQAEVAGTGRYRIAAALLDGARAPSYGGSGRRADPEIALALKQHFPLVLSGGLGPENIFDAVRLVGPFAVDVNSGVESSPGRKDHQKVASLFEQLARLGGHTR
jgi:phosphoribosylanthranilate isomerase